MFTFQIAIFTPEGEAFNGAVESLEAPGREGRFGVLAHHVPIIVALQRGILRVSESRRDRYFVTGEGVLEISGGKVTVLADSAVAVEDEAKARALFVSGQKTNEIRNRSTH